MTSRVFHLLEEARAREKHRTLFYRERAGEAERGGQLELAERLNALHADEQHHLARLTARILELGGDPPELGGHPPEPRDAPSPAVPPPAPPPPASPLAGWEARARELEEEEVAWYEGALEEGGLDLLTRELFQEILASERHHARELGGKWMGA